MERDRVRERDREIRTSTKHATRTRIRARRSSAPFDNAQGIRIWVFFSNLLEEPLFFQFPHHSVVDDVFDFELADRFAGSAE